MKDNSQSIYGCGKAGLEKPDNGRITRRGNKLYYHLFENTIGPMPLPGVKACLLYTSPSPRDPKTSRMPSSA